MTAYIGIMCQNAVTIIAGVAIAFYFDWRTALTSLVSIPILIGSAAMLQ